VAVSVVDIQVNSQGAVRGLRDVSNASKSAESAVGGLSKALGPLLAAFSAVSAAKFVFAKTAELETQTKSLQVLTGSVQQAKSIIQELQQLGAVTPFTSTELIDTAKRLNAFGVEGNKVVETTRRLADVAGATGAELQGLATAYGQVQAKGRLQGEELLQFQERGVALQEELRKMYGLTGDEFQKALSKGRISAEAVEVAVKRLTDAGGKYANGAIAQSDTLQGKFSTLTDGVEQLARTIGTVLAPVLKTVLTQAIQTLDAVNAVLAAGRGGGITRNLASANAAISLGATSDGIDRVAKGLSQISNQKNKAGIQQNLQALANYQTTLQRIGAEDPNANRAVQLQGAIQQKIQQNLAAQQQLNKAQSVVSKPTAIPALLGETGGGKKKTGKSDAERAAERAAKAAAKESERVGQVIRDRLAEGELLRVKSGLQDKISAAEISGDKMLGARLQGLQKEIDIQYQYAQALAQEKDVRAQQAIIFEGNTKLVANQQDTERELAAIQRQNEQDGLQAITAYLEKQYELNTAIQQQNALAESVSSTLGQGMTAVFDALIQGSDNWGKSLQQIASSVLVDIANQLIRIFVIEQAVSAIKSFLTPFNPSTPLGAGGGMVGKFGTFGPNYGIAQRALGGPVSAGSPYLVGERGPELFMPSRGGSIIPNNALGGGGTSVVVNVDASGSSVQGDQAQGRQLGVVISAAVQAELVKQQRPGGLLATTRR
jgi:tape measure domain-containing protein